VTLGSIVDDQKCSVLPSEAARGQRLDNGAQVPGRQKACDPLTFAVRVGVDRPTELKGNAGLSRPRATNQRVDRNVNLIIEPRLKLGEEIVTADQRKFSGLGREKI